MRLAIGMGCCAALARLRTNLSHTSSSRPAETGYVKLLSKEKLESMPVRRPQCLATLRTVCPCTVLRNTDILRGLRTGQPLSFEENPTISPITCPGR